MDHFAGLNEFKMYVLQGFFLNSEREVIYEVFICFYVINCGSSHGKVHARIPCG